MGRVLEAAQCPRDWAKLRAEKVVIQRGFDVEVDRCPECKGVYLDRGEIKKITGHDKLNELLTKHVALDSDSQLVCPGCGMVMDLEDADGVDVDVCLSCNGVWLDAGELDNLKVRPDEKFDDFTPEKMAELEREKKVRAADRKRWWKGFLYRLQGRDILDKMRRR